MSTYAAKVVLKNVTGVGTSKFAKKDHLASSISNTDELDIDKLKNVQSNLSNLKSKVDKLDVHKLVRVPVDLGKLSCVIKMMLKKMYIMLKLKKLKIKYLKLLT